MPITVTELSLTTNGLSGSSLELPAGQNVVTVVATTWSTAKVTLRASLTDSAGNFPQSAFVPDPYQLPKVAQYTASLENSYPVVIQGPCYLRGFVSDIGSASGVKIQVAS